jgi:predicted nucleic acid-binding protein
VAEVSGALLDTSVLIAANATGELDLPETAAISVITLGELRAGVELARDDATRRGRERRLTAVRAAFLPLDVDVAVAEGYGHVLATARREGRTAKATDLLIVATARATNRRLVTLDGRQAKLARAAGVTVYGTGRPSGR